MSESKHDLVIGDGRVATPEGIEHLDVVVHDGHIAALAPRGEGRGRRRIDAGGRLVLPGVVDSHVHVRDPGHPEKEDFASCSAAAAAGGVTTIMAMPNTDPVLDGPEGFAAARDAGEARSRVDFCLQALATGRNLLHVPALAALGAVSFEVFVGGVPDALATERRADQRKVFEAVAAAGGIAGLYPGESETVAALAEGGGGDPADILDAYSPLLEAGALLPALALAAKAGVRVHLRQTSSELTCLCVDRVRERVMGDRLTAEATPHHLLLTRAAFEEHGPAGYIMPPLREASDVDALWRAMAAGRIHTIGTDHSPHRADEKGEPGADLREVPPGFPGLETFLPAVLSAFLDRGLPVEDFVKRAAETPARLFGIFPRKGVVAPGADADLVIVDDETRWRIDPGRFLSKARYSPFTGREVRARADLTLVRGTVIWDDGEVTAEPGHGRLLVPRREAGC